MNDTQRKQLAEECGHRTGQFAAARTETLLRALNASGCTETEIESAASGIGALAQILPKLFPPSTGCGYAATLRAASDILDRAADIHDEFCPPREA